MAKHMLNLILFFVFVLIEHNGTVHIGIDQVHDSLIYKRVAISANGTSLTFNVLDFGAVGDGVTDNTFAFSSAFNADHRRHSFNAIVWRTRKQ